MNREPIVGEYVIIPREAALSWSDSVIVHEVRKVVGITPKKREVKLEGGIILRPVCVGEYDCLEATEENIQMANDSIARHQFAQTLHDTLYEINKHVTTGAIFDNLPTKEIEGLITVLQPLNKIAEEVKQKKANYRYNSIRNRD